MADKMAIWLAGEIKKRGWSIREMARRCGVSHTVIADMINLDHRPKVEVYTAIAKALNVDTQTILEIAGIAPPSPPTDTPDIDEMNEAFAYLTAEERQFWLGMLQNYVAERKRGYTAIPPTT